MGMQALAWWRGTTRAHALDMTRHHCILIMRTCGDDVLTGKKGLSVISDGQRELALFESQVWVVYILPSCLQHSVV